MEGRLLCRLHAPLSTQASGRRGGAGTGHSWNARPGFSGSNLPPAVSGRGGALGVTSTGPVPTAPALPHPQSLRLRPCRPGQLMWQPGCGPVQGRPWKPAEQTRTASPASGPHGQHGRPWGAARGAGACEPPHLLSSWWGAALQRPAGGWLPTALQGTRELQIGSLARALSPEQADGLSQPPATVLGARHTGRCLGALWCYSRNFLGL